MRQTEIARINLIIMSFRCLLRCGPPLPIPNREVKPTSADGTATAGEYVDAILRALERGPFFYAGFFGTQFYELRIQTRHQS